MILCCNTVDKNFTLNDLIPWSDQNKICVFTLPKPNTECFRIFPKSITSTSQSMSQSLSLRSAYMAHTHDIAAYYKQPVFHTLKVTLHHTNSLPLSYSLLRSVSLCILSSHTRPSAWNSTANTNGKMALTHT